MTGIMEKINRKPAPTNTNYGRGSKMLRYLTAGESHGKALIAILEGMPAGLKVDIKMINQELRRRQSGFGRGKRMQIEKDKIQIPSGVKKRDNLG